MVKIEKVGKKGNFEITIEKTNGEQVVDKIPAGPDLAISEGDTLQADQPLTNNPNVGGFGQEETEIVLQSPARIQGLIVFLAFVVLTQAFLVFKKKQFEKDILKSNQLTLEMYKGRNNKTKIKEGLSKLFSSILLKSL